MVEVRIKDDESFEALLRRFSKKVQQESIVSEARRRQNFESPTSVSYTHLRAPRDLSTSRMPSSA